jgi:1-aminocyclopropane-1-carboxylate deaminase/D-cysteine desulfhydrase-like pyridoxal-dependent ACC family enzyme
MTIAAPTIVSQPPINMNSTRGVLLDSVYPGKAFAAMLDLIEKGQLGSNEPILFLYTGSLPALFAF